MPKVTICPPRFADGYVPLQYGGEEIMGMVDHVQTAYVAGIRRWTISNPEKKAEYNNKYRQANRERLIP